MTADGDGQGASAAPSPPPGAVTVVVAARNAEGTLDAAVRSALSSPSVAECLVVDDASDDATGLVASRLAAGDPRVRVVTRAERGGPCVARNEGLARAAAPRVCFLDADDRLVEGGLEALAASLDAAPAAVAALGRFRAVDGEGAAADVGRWAADQLHPVVRRHGRLIESPDGMTPEALVTRLVSPPPGAWVVDTATARAVGGFDPRARRSEDLELLVRLAAAGRVLLVPRDVLEYRRHAGQRSAAHARRRWGRGQALWRMARAAPGTAASLSLVRGAAAYHLDLWATRRRAPARSLRIMGWRNLVVAIAVRTVGTVAALLPRVAPHPLGGPSGRVVD